MAWLSDADQGQFSLPRLDSGGAARARPRAVHGSCAARGHAWRAGMAVVLLQGTDDRARALSGARHLHSAHEAEEHAALDEGRTAHHSPRSRVLRLSLLIRSY